METTWVSGEKPRNGTQVLASKALFPLADARIGPCQRTWPSCKVSNRATIAANAGPARASCLADQFFLTSMPQTPGPRAAGKAAASLAGTAASKKCAPPYLAKFAIQKLPASRRDLDGGLD